MIYNTIIPCTCFHSFSGGKKSKILEPSLFSTSEKWKMKFLHSFSRSESGTEMTWNGQNPKFFQKSYLRAPLTDWEHGIGENDKNHPCHGANSQYQNDHCLRVNLSSIRYMMMQAWPLILHQLSLNTIPSLGDPTAPCCHGVQGLGQSCQHTRPGRSQRQRSK